MSQLTLDFAMGGHRHPRECSRRARQSVDRKVDTMRGAVLEAIAAAGVNGMTDEEIQVQLGMPGNTERPRRGELERMGLVVASEQTRAGSSGRQMTVWVLRAVGEMERDQ